eukprot:23109-Eustigmatos_ZCMA.PRE.1
MLQNGGSPFDCSVRLIVWHEDTIFAVDFGVTGLGSPQEGARGVVWRARECSMVVRLGEHIHDLQPRVNRRDGNNGARGLVVALGR